MSLCLSVCVCVCVCVAFVLWAKQELQYFVSVFSGQVFVTKYNLSAVAECVTEASAYCSQVCPSVRLSVCAVLCECVLWSSVCHQVQLVCSGRVRH